MILPNTKILCVDSYPDGGELIRQMLLMDDHRCEFVIAATPQQALGLIEADAFDLYLLEHRLPGMSGVELCRRIREKNSQTPIVFFSGMARRADRAAALAAGADEYLIKPDDLDRVVETIVRLADAHALLNSAEKRPPGIGGGLAAARQSAARGKGIEAGRPVFSEQPASISTERPLPAFLY